MVQLLDVFAEGTELIIVVRGMGCGMQHNMTHSRIHSRVHSGESRSIRRAHAPVDVVVLFELTVAAEACMGGHTSWQC